MATLSDFKTRLGKLTATKGLAEDVLEVFIDKALLAWSEYNPEQVLMKKVPVDRESDGFYAVPTDAESVTRVLVHDTDIEIEFKVERDAETNEDKIRLGLISRPSTAFISGDYEPEANGALSGVQFERGYARGGVDGEYDHFDISYLRIPEIERIERLSRQDLDTIELYVEHLGYLDKASQTENLVDITDQDSSGDSTTLRQSNIGRQNRSLADGKKEEFEKRAIRPYASERTTYAHVYTYSRIR